MLYKIVSIRDRVTQQFMEPATVINLEAAKRDFKRLVLSQETIVKEDDLSLWYIADFDSDSGEVTYVKPVYVVTASDYEVTNG